MDLEVLGTHLRGPARRLGIASEPNRSGHQRRIPQLQAAVVAGAARRIDRCEDSITFVTGEQLAKWAVRP